MMTTEKSGVDTLLLRQLEAFIIGLLKPFSLADLDNAVQKRALLMMMMPTDFKTKKMVVVARNLVQKANREELDKFDAGLVAKWVVKNRPEVSPYFLHNEPFCHWFRVNVRTIRKYFGMDL